MSARNPAILILQRDPCPCQCHPGPDLYTERDMDQAQTPAGDPLSSTGVKDKSLVLMLSSRAIVAMIAQTLAKPPTVGGQQASNRWR
jgi:hypothetical protein